MASLRREMDRLFDRFFDVEPVWEGLATGGEWGPKVDLSETKEALVSHRRTHLGREWVTRGSAAPAAASDRTRNRANS